MSNILCQKYTFPTVDWTIYSFLDRITLRQQVTYMCFRWRFYIFSGCRKRKLSVSTERIDLRMNAGRFSYIIFTFIVFRSSCLCFDCVFIFLWVGGLYQLCVDRSQFFCVFPSASYPHIQCSSNKKHTQRLFHPGSGVTSIAFSLLKLMMAR